MQNDTNSSLASNDTTPFPAAEDIISTVASNGDVITSPVARPPAPYEPPAPTQTPEAPEPRKLSFNVVPLDQVEEKFPGHRDILNRLSHGVINDADRAAVEAHLPGHYDAIVGEVQAERDIYQFRNKANWARYDAVNGAGSAARKVAAMDADRGTPNSIARYEAAHGAGSWARTQAKNEPRQQRYAQDKVRINQFLAGFIRGNR
jgi:hypothetical protein